MPTEKSDHARWFAEEVQPYEASLRAYLHVAAPRAADVDDLMQESYIRLLRMRTRGQIRSVKAVLFVIARNAVRDALRHIKIKREVPPSELDMRDLADETAGLVEGISRRHEQLLAAEAIRALPERCREVLVMRKILGLPQRTIAKRLGISENTVESLVSRGLRRCSDYVRRKTSDPR